jgi:hypothetical protein
LVKDDADSHDDHEVMTMMAAGGGTAACDDRFDCSGAPTLAREARRVRPAKPGTPGNALYLI